MNTLGEKLRRERELRGVSLSEVAEATRIQKKFLQALEENHYDILPAPVFVTGFLRTYASHLGLDADSLVTEYESTRQPGQPAAEPALHSVVEGEGRSLPLVVGAVIALVLVVGVVSYLHRPITKHEVKASPDEELVPQPQPAPAPPLQASAQQEVGAESPHKPADESPRTDVAKRESSAGEGVKQPGAEQKAEKPRHKEPAKAEEKPVDARHAEEKVPAASGEKTKKTFAYNVGLTATTEDVWVYVVIDGGDVRDMYIRAGQSVVLRGNSGFLLTTGNALFLKVTVNGKGIAIPGSEKNKVVRNWQIPLGE